MEATQANTTSDVIYRVDMDDRLISVNEHWNDFARANDCPGLCDEHVHHKSLWDHIHDTETLHIHQALLQAVRTRGALHRLPFRCDAPDLRRFMEMDILPLAEGVVEYRCRTLRTETRDPVPLHGDRGRPEAGHMKMCCWCKKLNVRGDEWLEIEPAIHRYELLSLPHLPAFIHTICDDCSAYLGERTRYVSDPGQTPGSLPDPP